MTGRIIINTDHPILMEIFDEPIPVLFYEEDGATIAHALPLDILAYGSDVKEAGKELVSMIKTHLSECLENGRPDLIWHNAPNTYYLRYISERASNRRDKMSAVKSAPINRTKSHYRPQKTFQPYELKIRLPEKRIINSWGQSKEFAVRA